MPIKRQYRVLKVALLLVFLFASIIIGWSFRAASQAATFTFAAYGDIGGNSATNKGLAAVQASGSAFSIALGDLSYSELSESAWCARVKSYLGATYPFQLLAGNHEDDNPDDGDDGYIANFAACLPDRMHSTGVYAAHYYFDYQNLRTIMITPDVPAFDHSYAYNTVGSSDYTWVRDRIREAKAAGRWVVVGMHKNCISVGEKEDCSVGENLMDLLIAERADIVLQGHDHTYQRSKQLKCANADQFIASCVADDGADNTYTRGAGTLFVVSGAFGQGLYDVSKTDAEAGYFSKAMGANAGYDLVRGTSFSGRGNGFIKFTVGPDRIDAEWVMTNQLTSGTVFTDRFSILGAGGATATPLPPTSTPTATPPLGNDLARGKPATASSIEAAGFEAARAVDGASNTRWASAEGADPQWLRVDLGSVQNIKRVVLNWEAAYASSYQIQVSNDGATWSPIYSTSGGSGGIDDLAVTGSGRYLRMYGTARGTAYGYSLWAFEAYGATPATPTGSPTSTPVLPTATPAGACVTTVAGGVWANTPFPAQGGSFGVEFDAAPSHAPMNGLVALSQGPQSAYTGFAALVRFSPTGQIDARNGGVFAAASTISYTAGATYHVRLAINVPAHTYSIYVTPPGGAEQTLGLNYVFRTEQSSVASLSNWGAQVNSSSAGSVKVCGFVVRG